MLLNRERIYIYIDIDMSRRRQLFMPVAAAAVAALLALVLHAALNSPISPRPLLLPSSSSSSSTLLSSNDILQRVDKLGEGVLQGPEDVCVDPEGTLYTASRDGWIQRMQPNMTSWEDWVFVGGDAVLGLAPSAAGGLIVCDVDKGLLKVGADREVVILASEVDGKKISFADEAIEASDGTIYFSDASDKFGLHDWFLDVLEAEPHGRLLKYDPSTKKASVVLSGLGFANGIALSPSQDFVIVCETWRFQCLRHWLKGELRGSTEVFIDNLPGGPDNINLAPDGSYWIALLKLRSRGLNLIHGSSTVKRVLAAFPKLSEMISKPMTTRAMVINVGPDGSIRRMMDDSNGRVMSFVTSAMEYDGHLYLGSLGKNYIGRLALH